MGKGAKTGRLHLQEAPPGCEKAESKEQRDKEGEERKEKGEEHKNKKTGTEAGPGDTAVSHHQVVGNLGE